MNTKNSWDLCVRAITEGIKIRATTWVKDYYIYYKDGKWITTDGLYQKPSFNSSDLTDYDWEEYKEKPKKIKKTFYRAWYINDGLLADTMFYPEKNRLLDMLTERDRILVEIEEKVVEVVEI